MKSGTTSLFHYLSQHPQIYPSFVKEVHFFDSGLNQEIDNFEKGTEWYRAHFPFRINGGITGEASPSYIFNPLSPKRIYTIIPQVKLVAILRNPTDRAISHYYHEVRMKREPLSITEALQNEKKRLKKELAKNFNLKSEIYLHNSYKRRGLYKKQLERYLRYFPRKQLLIINSEKFFSDPKQVIKKVFNFLSVYEEFEVKNLEPKNVGRNKIVDKKVYEYLDEYFLPHNEELYKLIDESFEW